MTEGPRSISQQLRAPGFARVFVAVTALVIVSVCGFNSLQSIGRPFPGFFVWENLFVPAMGESSWTGVSSGLEFHSWLLSADGVPLETAADLDRALEGKAPGEIVEYTAERHGIRYDVSVPMMSFDSRAYLTSTGIYLFNAVALMILALVTIYLKPRGEDSGALFLFATMLAVYMATSIDLFGPYIFRAAYYLFAPLTPTAALYMASRFPMERTRHRYEGPLLALASAGSLTFAITFNMLFFDDRATLVVLDRLLHVYIGAAVLGLVVFFGWHFSLTTDHSVRQRLKAVLISVIGAFLPAVALFAFYYGFTSIPLNFLTVSFVIFAGGIGYAIAKHDLFHVDRVVKRAVAYILLSALVLGAYTVAIEVFGFLFENMTGAAQHFGSAVLILFLLLLLNPSRDRIQNLVDRIYDRRRYEYRDVVQSASRRFRSILDFNSLVHTALDLVDETIQPVSAAIFTVNAQGNAIRRGLLLCEGNTGERRLAARDVPCPELADIVSALEQRDLVTSAQDVLPRSVGESETAELRGGNMATAMRMEGRLFGFLIVGPKRAGGYHTADDAELMRTMSDQLALALENAGAYKTIDILNRNLEEQNVALETSNRELQEAQDQLIRTERLAAVGELASAVAHAIRNPLAGMKMAAEYGEAEFADHQSAISFKDISGEAERLNERITNLLDFARPFEPNPQLVVFSEVVVRAVEISRGKAEERAIRLSLTTDDGGLKTKLDPVLFEQVIVELLANAIDASQDGAEVVIKTGRTERADGDALWVAVRDTGSGVPEQNRHKIFDLFFTTKKTGTGFGLATVKKIVERHGGTVTVENCADSGASFLVKIPTD